VGAGGILYMLAIDRRPLYQTGLLVERGQKRYLPLFVFLGALTGGLVVLVNLLSNAVTFALGTPSLWHLAVAVAELIGSSAYLFFFLAAFLPVVLSHTRGFWRGAIWTAALLGLYLTPAAGDTMVSMMNGFLLALVLVLVTVRTGHIWTAVLSYATLRILCDVVFGDPAFAFLQHAIFDPTFAPGRELTSGGVGGYFSGLGATLVLALALIVVLYLPRRAPREEASSFTQSSL
jgi:glucose-6-phosphate-specific signal transduction histidine kinase